MLNGRKRSVLRGAFSNAGTSVILQVVNLLIIPIYLDLTSSELYGIWLALGAVLAWVKIGDMGLGLSLTRRSIEALELGNYALLRNYITGSMFVTLLLGTLVYVLGYLSVDYLATFLNVPIGYKDDFKNTFLILLIVAWIRPTCGVLSSIINAKQHLASLHIQNTVAALFSIAITLVLLLNGFEISAFAYGLLAEAAIILLMGYYYLKFVDKNFFIFPVKCQVKDIRRLLEFGVPYQILKISNLVATNTDNIIISAYLGAAAVTTYVITGKLAFLLAVFLVSIAPNVLFPGFSQLFELNEIVKIRRIYYKLSEITVRIGMMSAVFFYLVNEIFVNAWVGGEIYGGIFLTIGFVLWILFESFIRGITAIIYASGNLKGLTLASCVEAILNISLTLMLIAPLGLFGVILGTVFSRIVTVCYVPVKINKILDIEQSEYFVKLVKTISICIISMLISGTVLREFLSPHIDPFLQIFMFGCVLLSVNIISFEGVFIYGLRGVSLHNRFKLLKDSYMNY